jgi:SOS-response transcriptional repressor LexA
MLLTFASADGNVFLMPSTKNPDPNKLTEAQRELFLFVRKYINRTGTSPVYSDIAAAMGTKKAAAIETTARVISKGYLGKRGSLRRTLYITEKGKTA